MVRRRARLPSPAADGSVDSSAGRYAVCLSRAARVAVSSATRPGGAAVVRAGRVYRASRQATPLPAGRGLIGVNFWASELMLWDRIGVGIGTPSGEDDGIWGRGDDGGKGDKSGDTGLTGDGGAAQEAESWRLQHSRGQDHPAVDARRRRSALRPPAPRHHFTHRPARNRSPLSTGAGASSVV